MKRSMWLRGKRFKDGSMLYDYRGYRIVSIKTKMNGQVASVYKDGQLIKQTFSDVESAAEFIDHEINSPLTVRPLGVPRLGD